MNHSSKDPFVKSPGSLWLIPVPLIPHQNDSLPAAVRLKALSLRHYFVENLRTARRILKSLDPSVAIHTIQFSEVNRHQPADTALLEKWLKEGLAVGVMSEAGCPGIADPGSALVEKAHQIHARVIPLVGPSSLLLALMASGLNGQGFRFTGYLPIKEPGRGKAIKALEHSSRQRSETQIFIETPYRNNQLLADLIKNCHPDTRLCIAANLTEEHRAFIKTQRIKAWKQLPVDLHKQPAVFLLLA